MYVMLRNTIVAVRRLFGYGKLTLPADQIEILREREQYAPMGVSYDKATRRLLLSKRDAEVQPPPDAEPENENQRPTLPVPVDTFAHLLTVGIG